MKKQLLSFLLVFGISLLTTTSFAQIQALKHPVEMVLVKGGTFKMGGFGDPDDQTVHTVTLSDYSIGKYLITVSQFEEFIRSSNYRTDAEKDGWSWVSKDGKWVKVAGVNWMFDAGGNYYSSYENNNNPVLHISWDDANIYCQWLSKMTGKQYRLPTEAEWEFAARGGTKSQGYLYSGSNQINDIGWYLENSKGGTHPVGQKKANELGLFDMTGNLWEWCNDWYGADYYKNSSEIDPVGPLTGTSRVLRGGGWGTAAAFCSYKNRFFNFPDNHGNTDGFRIVLVEVTHKKD